jgi:hypothetical protein
MAKEAIETYLELLAEEITGREWVDIHGIGKIQVSVEKGSGAKYLNQFPRLRTHIRLTKDIKAQCYKN